MENRLTPELLEKAKQAKSAEELLALARENGMEFTEESARAYFEQLHKSGELSDEELDNVSGGTCYKGNRVVVTLGHTCDKWTCERCGKTGFTKCEINNHKCPDGNSVKLVDCNHCKYIVYEKGLWLCNNPQTMK